MSSKTFKYRHNMVYRGKKKNFNIKKKIIFQIFDFSNDQVRLK